MIFTSSFVRCLFFWRGKRNSLVKSDNHLGLFFHLIFYLRTSLEWTQFLTNTIYLEERTKECDTVKENCLCLPFLPFLLFGQEYNIFLQTYRKRKKKNEMNWKKRISFCFIWFYFIFFFSKYLTYSYAYN